MIKTENVVPKIKVRCKGTFDLNQLYKDMKHWLDFQGYGGHKESFHENLYVERVQGDSKQLEVEWSAQKNETDYIAFNIKLTIMVLGMKDVEVEIGNRKRKMQSG